MLRSCVSVFQRVGRAQHKNALLGGQTIQKRGLAAGLEEQKVNMWEAPTQLSKWKTEHLVLTIMAGYGLAYLGVKAYFSGGDTSDEKAVKQEQA